MKFKFPLQKVLEHRKIKEDLAQKDFQDVMNELNQFVKRFEEMDALLKHAHVQAYEMQMEGGTQGPALSQINDFIRNHKILMEAQKKKIAQQETVVEQKRDLLREAAVETKIINRFKEQKFDEFRKKIETDDQNEMDEQSILRFRPLDKKESA